MEEIIENTDVEAVDEETPEAELTTDTDWEAEAKKARGIAQRLRTKLTKATEKKVVVEATKEPVKTETPKTGELDETALLLLEVKGVKTDDADEMRLVDEWRDAGKSPKAMLASKIFQAELKEIRDEKAVKDATPSNTKRSGSGGGSDLATALAKYVQSGYSPDALPTDFKLRSAVVNAVANETTTNKPAWHK